MLARTPNHCIGGHPQTTMHSILPRVWFALWAGALARRQADAAAPDPDAGRPRYTLEPSTVSLLQTSRTRLGDAAAARSYQCGPWRGLPQVFDALPGGGFRRRHGGDVLTELPDAGCALLLSDSDEAPGKHPLAMLQASAPGHRKHPAHHQPKEEDASSMVERHASRHAYLAHREPGSSLPLLPYPANLTLAGAGSGTFPLSPDVRVVLGRGVSAKGPAARALRAHLGALPKRAARAEATIRLQLDGAAGGGSRERYSLAVGHGVATLSAPAAEGLFYAVQTLRQLTPESGPADVPSLAIEDAPQFGWRGLHLDVSRHFFNATHVKSLLDVMASLKLNRFHWHLTDDQGWRLPVEGYPKLTALASEAVSSGAYTVDEIRDVVQHAHARHIRVLPEIDVPGHAAAVIAAYPELGNSDVANWRAPMRPMDKWGTFDYTMAPSAATMKFLDDVFTQVADLFPDAMVHIGGDEVSRKEWQKSKLAETVRRVEHLKNVQEYFNAKCADILHSKNISMFAWDEARTVGGFPKDGTIVAWRSRDEVVKAAKAGKHVVNADQGVLYFDHYQGKERTEPKAFGGYSPLESVYEYDPIPPGLTREQQSLVVGGQAQLWSEYIPDAKHLEYMAFPRSHALAERLWTPREQLAGFEEFRERLAVRLKDLDKWGINYRKLSAP